MPIVVIDCGTTNSRLSIVDRKGSIISNINCNVGIQDVAISGSNQILKEELQKMFEKALSKACIDVTRIDHIFASGVITSDLGLAELQHLQAPCTLDNLANNITRVKLDIFPPQIPVYFVRGIKNPYDPFNVSIKDAGILDTMRGEETQIAGLIAYKKIKLPAVIIILSSHTKLIAVDEKLRILGSITTLSGQLYEVIGKDTVLKKSLKKDDDFNGKDYFNPDIFDIAYNEAKRFGFLRGLMSIRYLDILAHAKGHEIQIFTESLFAAEDALAIREFCKIMKIGGKNFILIGPRYRSVFYEYLLKTKISPRYEVTPITDAEEIRRLTIEGIIYLAVKAGILN